MKSRTTEIESKVCECGKTYIRKKGAGSDKQWDKRRYCSHTCAVKYFYSKRQDVLWANPQYRKNMSKAHLGQNSPMKGKPFFAMRGANNPRWKGGITPENRKIRASLEYKLWRLAVFERDNWTCVWCGLHSGGGKAVIFHADHIKSFAKFPELRLAIDNGRTLCIECHKKTETYASKK